MKSEVTSVARQYREKRHRDGVRALVRVSRSGVHGKAAAIFLAVMGLTMILQQRLQPRAADPQQAQQQKMTMYIMMFVIGFIFYSMPSGLVLYFLTSTLVGIGEAKLIRRKLAAEAQGK